MKTKKSLRTLAVVLIGISVGSCSIGDDDADGGPIGTDNDAALVGIWQYTVQNEGEVTLNLVANGSFAVVEADFVASTCISDAGTWTNDDAIIFTRGSADNDGDSVYFLEGDVLTVNPGEGDPLEIFTRITTGMIECASYGF